MPNPNLTEFERNSLQKPAKGAAYMASKDRRANRRDAEDAEMRAGRKRDGNRCRWPGCTGKYRGLDLPIDMAHFLEHRKMGGNPTGDRTMADLVVALCRRHHNALDDDVIGIEPTSDANANGLLAFYERNKETGQMEHIATETAIGVSVAVGA